jgi:putative transposase
LILGITRHQFYYFPTGTAKGKQASEVTVYSNYKTKKRIEVLNEVVVKAIIYIKQNLSKQVESPRPDLANWYRLITYTLQVEGYYINHKKVYRLMKNTTC